jgi:hypothetical protein
MKITHELKETIFHSILACLDKLPVELQDEVTTKAGDQKCFITGTISFTVPINPTAS